ncbi:MAG: LbtU family siderophore porin [Thermodesulfobacteriota bacterium]|nr:LbtU family siderophore porin [Thermodesulfobacteriota bacterium]
MYLKTLKALLLGLCIAAVGMISWAPNSLAADGNLEQQVQELIQQNQALTDRLNQLEQRIAEPRAVAEPAYAGAESILGRIEDTIHIHGLLEFGGAYHSTDMNVGGHEQDSDLAMTTVELGIAAEVNDWVSAEMALLYEDPTFENDDTNFEVDTAIITIANEEATPAFLMAGKMFVPFGALLEHFPDDPLIHAPLTLLLGETNEKALLIGAELEGFTVSAYVFNGDVEEGDGDNVIESYGFDANYAFEDETQDLDMLVGASYISNIAESDHIEDHLGGDIDSYTPGAAVYFHVGLQGFFFDAEYMTATEEFDESDGAHMELVPNTSVDPVTWAYTQTGGIGYAAKPEVWNLEVGYNYNWWKNLEITLKVAGSDDGEGLGFPKERYGINFNQEIFDDTVFSVGYIYDYYDKDDHNDRNSQDLLFGQLAVEF